MYLLQNHFSAPLRTHLGNMSKVRYKGSRVFCLDVVHNFTFAHSAKREVNMKQKSKQASAYFKLFSYGTKFVIVFLLKRGSRCVLESNPVRIRIRWRYTEGMDESNPGMCVTVWSAPNYCYRCGNVASILAVRSFVRTEIGLVRHWSSPVDRATRASFRLFRTSSALTFEIVIIRRATLETAYC